VLPHVRVQLLQRHRVPLDVSVGAGAASQVHAGPGRVPLVRRPRRHDDVHGALGEGENGRLIVAVLRAQNRGVTGVRGRLTD